MVFGLGKYIYKTCENIWLRAKDQICYRELSLETSTALRTEVKGYHFNAITQPMGDSDIRRPTTGAVTITEAKNVLQGAAICICNRMGLREIKD